MNRKPLYPGLALTILALTLALGAPAAADAGPDAAVTTPAAVATQQAAEEPSTAHLGAPLVPLPIPMATSLHCDEAPKGRIPCEECPDSCILDGEVVPCECMTGGWLGDFCICPA